LSAATELSRVPLRAKLVLVPMLVLLPVPLVPLFVAAGLLLDGMPEHVRGRVPLDRSLLRLVNSWHVVGPALVLIAAGEPHPTPRHLPLYAAAVLVLFSLPLIGLLAHFARDRKSHIDKALELSSAYRGPLSCLVMSSKQTIRTRDCTVRTLFRSSWPWPMS
jgi:hypothetical protein